MVALLVVLPVALYWPTLFHTYGFRDDYSILREAREEPGKVTRVCAMQARPLYGVVLERSFALARGVDDLHWIRFGTAVLVGVNLAALFLVLTWLGWNRGTALLVASLLGTVPSTQVMVSWAVAWPLCLAVLLSLVGFVFAERAFRSSRGWARGCQWAAAVVAVCGSALTYQPNSLFYLALVAAAVVSRSWCGLPTLEWFVRHGVTAFIGVASAFSLMMVAFANGWVPVSHRVAIEHDLAGKIVWFVREPLHNALALLALNDSSGRALATCAAVATGLLLAAGLVRGCRRHGANSGLWWIAALGTLLFGSFAVNFMVADRWPMYRVLLPMTATVLVAVAFSLVAIDPRRVLARTVLVVALCTGVWLARRQSFDLIAAPQSAELISMQKGAEAIDPRKRPSVFVITPTNRDRIQSRLFSDEFGSLSTDSDWVPKEMLKLIMRSRYPAMPNVTEYYTFACGRTLPKGKSFDVIIDLRRMKDSVMLASPRD